MLIILIVEKKGKTANEVTGKSSYQKRDFNKLINKILLENDIRKTYRN